MIRTTQTDKIVLRQLQNETRWAPEYTHTTVGTIDLYQRFLIGVPKRTGKHIAKILKTMYRVTVY